MTRESRQVSPVIWAMSALLLVLFGFQSVSEYLSSSIRLGIVLQETGSQVNITSVKKESPAQKAGVPADSVLKAINGHAITSISDITPLLKAAGGNNSLHLTVEQNGTAREIRVVPGVQANYRSLVLNLLILIVYISIGMAAFRASGIDHRTRLLAWFSFAVALDITTYINVSYWPGFQLLYSSFKQMLAVLQFALIFHLLSLIPRPAPWMKWKAMPAAIYILALGFHLLVVLSGFGLVSLGDTAMWFSTQLLNNNITYISWGVIILVILLYQLFGTSNWRERQQVKWILLSVVPWLSLQLSDILVPDAGWVYSDWYSFADKLIHLLFPAGILAAIFRYNLLDLNDLFPRNFFYSLLTTLLLAIPALAIVETGILLSRRYSPEAAIWLSNLAMLALGYTFSPARDRLIQALEGRSWYKQHNLGQELRLLAEELSNMDGLEEIERQLTSRLAALMHSQGVILHLNQGFLKAGPSPSRKEDPVPCWMGNEGERICLKNLELHKQDAPLHLGRPGETDALLKQLYRHGLELIVPLQLHGEHFGTLMIGRSLGQQRYSWRETELLNLFAQSISTKFANALLHSQLQFDELTGLYRRRPIVEIMEHCIDDFRKTGQLFTIAMIDLDDFKMINDRHGHLAGDRILKKAAAHAMEMLSKEDRLGRYGGEEFLLVMPGRDMASARWLCEHVRWALEALQHEDHSATTASIGIACIEEVHHEDLPLPEQALELIALADSRLYKAKAEGKNRIVHG